MAEKLAARDVREGEKSLDEICTKYRLTKEDIKRFTYFYLNRVRHYNVFIIVNSVLMVISLFYWILISKPLFLGMFFVLLLIVLYYSSRYIMPILRFKKKKAREITYRFSDEGIQIDDEDTLVKLGWKQYKSVLITPQLYVFKLRPRGYWALPADAVEDMFEFEKLIFSQKEKVGLKVKVM